MAIFDFSPNKGALLFLVISALIDTSSSYKILLIPLPFTSPVQEATTIASKLLAHNHTVVLVMPKSFPNLDELKEEFDVIEYKIKYPDMFTQPPSWIIDGYTGPQNQLMRHIAKDMEPFCTNPLEDDEYIQRINATKFDLAIIEADLQRCNMLILHELGIPYVSFVLNLEQWRWKAPVLPSFVPTMFLGIFTERMTLLERMRNLFGVLDWALRPGVFQFQDSFLEKYAPSITYDVLYGESLLFLVNNDFLIDYPRPVMPNEVFVGGLTTKPAAQLRVCRQRPRRSDRHRVWYDRHANVRTVIGRKICRRIPQLARISLCLEVRGGIDRESNELTSWKLGRDEVDSTERSPRAPEHEARDHPLRIQHPVRSDLSRSSDALLSKMA